MNSKIFDTINTTCHILTVVTLGVGQEESEASQKSQIHRKCEKIEEVPPHSEFDPLVMNE